jgi:hypothetical protein
LIPPADGSAPPPADGALIPPADGSAPPPADNVQSEYVTVRVLATALVDSQTYRPNQLVRFDADVYASLDQTRFDDSEAAVAYCESIGEEVVTHEQGDDGEQS